MTRLEELLSQNKTIITKLTVPDELEGRLHDSLYTHAANKGRLTRRGLIAAACLLILLLFTQSNTLAYYGYRLLGYDQIMNATLQTLNNLGKGQLIGKSWQFENGPTLVLDGVMLDDNQLIAFYTIKGNSADIKNISIYGMNGIVNYPLQSAVGKINANGREIKYQASFAAPYFFENNLSFAFQWQNETQASTQNGTIHFTLNRKQAMGHTLKQDLNFNKRIGDNLIRFDSILASPTSTVVKGTIATPMELARDQFLGERIRPQKLEILLLANQRSVAVQASEMSTGMNGIRFSYKFDALPSHLDSLTIELKSLTADFDVNQIIHINKDVNKELLYINGCAVTFQKFEESNGDSYLTISSDESTIITRVFMIMDGKKISLDETISDQYDKKSNGTVMHTRTLHFSGQGKELQLFVERMAYQTDCNEKFIIPVQK